MKQSDSIKNLTGALLDFKKKCPAIKADAENALYKRKFATLTNILNVVEPLLRDNGLLITQWLDGKMTLCTQLVHAPTGEYMSATHEWSEEKRDGFTGMESGAALSFQRRHAIVSILCLNVDDSTQNPTDGTAVNKDADADTQAPEENGGHPFDKDERPWLEKAMYDSMVERIKKGEKGVFAEAVRMHRIKDKTRDALQNHQRLHDEKGAKK